MRNSELDRNTPPKYCDINRKRKCKKIPESLMVKVEGEIKSLLHAHRDTLRNLKDDTTKLSFRCNEGFYGEAFGIMRGLSILGFGYFGSCNLDGIKEGHEQKEQNLKWWFNELEHQVLEEEGFYNKTHRCEHCLAKYHKDTKSILERKVA